MRKDMQTAPCEKIRRLTDSAYRSTSLRYVNRASLKTVGLDFVRKSDSG